MTNPIFEEFIFDIGWKNTAIITYFGLDLPITVKLKAYFEEDGITYEQEKAYLDYIKDQKSVFTKIERLLQNFANNAPIRFTPRMLLFERDGSYALLCDDEEDWDDGVAVCISPDEKVMFQDDYL